jgi:5-methylcytosine-specific restriction protein A
MSSKKLSDNPICEICGQRLSTEVDHIEPHQGDLKLFFNYKNLQALCKKCHSKKTAQEQHEKQKNSFY